MKSKEDKLDRILKPYIKQTFLQGENRGKMAIVDAVQRIIFECETEGYNDSDIVLCLKMFIRDMNKCRK